ncbi:MAG: SDR family NAD(P)-dependent oxidoreductase [Phycisphaerales bacterium]
MPQTNRTPLDAHLVSRYGPWAVVTGASSGIGQAFARRLAKAGLNVVLAARRTEELRAVADDLQSRCGVACRVLTVDLATPEGPDGLAEATSDIDAGLLVAAAGFGSCGSFHASELSESTAMIDVNCRSLTALSWHFARRLSGRRRGGVVLMGSLVGFQGVPGSAVYAATKAYVQSFAEGMHHELKPLGVDVISSAPGPVHTEFAARAGMKFGFGERAERVAEGTLRALGSRGTVRPGLIAKGLELSLKTLPRWGRVRMMGTIMRGMAVGACTPP